MNRDISSRLAKARTTLLLDFEFFGQLALRLETVLDDTIPTEACTDGRRVLFHPEKADRFSDRELVWLWAHEIMHCAKGDLWRGKGRDMERWNRATDYKINQIIADVIASQPGASNRMQAPAGILLDRQYDELSSEEIYRTLPGDKPDQQPKPQPGAFTAPAPEPKKDDDGDDGSGSGSGDDDGEGQGEGDGNALAQGSDDLEQEWKQAVATAANVSRMRQQGNLPAGVAATVEELLDAAVPWQDLLRQFAARVTRDDYTWKRPNRRFTGSGVMLPALRSEGLGTIAVIRDTSGSITPEMNRIFLSELQDILDTCRPEIIHVIDCDARVHQHLEFRPGDDLRGTGYKGGGGTRFEPAFDFLEERGIQPDALVYLTDLYGSFPERPPQYPVLWLNYGMPRNKAPFGETVDVPKPEPLAA